MYPKIIQDIYLIEFFDKKTRNANVIDSGQLIIMSRAIGNNQLEGICNIGLDMNNALHINSNGGLYHNIYHFLRYRLNNLLGILDCCKGKLSICGIEIIPLTNFPEIYNHLYLYFDSCTVIEAERMLIDHFSSYKLDYVVYNGKNWIKVMMNNFVIIISTNIYNDKNHLLRSIGSTVEQHGWNPIDSYFTTISGAVSAITCTYIIEPNTSISNIFKYNVDYGLNIALPGVRIFNDKRTFVTQGGNITTDNNSLRKEISITPNRNYKPVFDVCNLVRFESACTFMTKPERFSSILSYASEVMLIPFKDWFLQEYKSTKVGIDDDKYIAMANCMKQYNIPKETFSLVRFRV